ncbi:universal stress protein [Janthinobacterium sp.]|uniref:universal stress protein n=1 Tax=Janthinobacterium sp. TaxID=1871054 RepID=UPI00293D5F3F|nr:universal stress protein [Janthinobacterium sp.]
MLHTHPAPPSQRRAAPAGAADAALLLLLPIKRAGDVVYGARYAKRMLEWGIRVKVHLLHVTPAGADAAALFGAADPERALREARAAAMLDEATLYLSRSGIEHSTRIVCGDLVFSILDAAELLDCREIVLPAAKAGAWRLFSGDLARRLARASRSANVVLADPHGMRCPAPAK